MCNATTNTTDPASTMTSVFRGKHSVPPGVVVEELKAVAGKHRLTAQCPAPVRALLEQHNLVPVYDALVRAICADKAAFTAGGLVGRHWNDDQLTRILREFQPQFAAAGNVRVALCRRTSRSGTILWLEFVDNHLAAGYVPQYDVTNLQSQPSVQTICTRLVFPRGVVTEQLDRFGGGDQARDKLRDEIPADVRAFLTRKDLLSEYNALVYELADEGYNPIDKRWDSGKMVAVVARYRPLFDVKDADVFVSQKREFVSHGYHGGGPVTYRWLEFVDRRRQPNYRPQRGA